MCNVAICIPVHNRRELTLSCLRHLKAIGDLRDHLIIIVDDGSNDGTSNAVEKEFPSVRILSGDGGLWWGGGITLATKYALDHRAEQVIWLNDDTFPESGAVRRLVELNKKYAGILSGVTGNEFGNIAGYRKTFKGMIPVSVNDAELQEVDAVAGNFVSIKRSVFEALGFIDTQYFPHTRGEIEWCLRAKQAGCGVAVATTVFAENRDEEFSHRDSWFFGSYPILNAWKAIFSLKSSLNPKSSWQFYLRHWGAFGVILFLFPYSKLLVATVYRLMVFPFKMMKPSDTA